MQNHLLRIHSLCLSVLIALNDPFAGYAQDVPVPVPKMNVVVVEGEATIHNVREKKAANVVVLVRDGNRKPLPNAEVTFTLPAEGAGGTFSDGSRKLVVTTNNEGLAFARGIRPNASPGPFRIEVTAVHLGQTATVGVTNFNMNVVKESKGGSGKVIAILGVLGAAATGGAVYALRNSSSPVAPTPPTPIFIAPGAGSVGPPR